MRSPCIVHLVDDTTAGGVMRVLDHILTAPQMGHDVHHEMIRVQRGQIRLGRIKADIIVSHLAISWRAIPMLLALRARHPLTPMVHVEHSYTKAFVAANVVRKWRFATLLRIGYRLFNRIVAVSQAQGAWLVDCGAVRASALSVIPSCVNLSAFRRLKAAHAPIRVIGAIGRLDRQKGFDTLISAFRRVARADLALHIYGQGCETETLCNLAGDDPRIRFMGFIDDPVAAMAAVDLVAMPSHWEAYGLVAIEALAAGRTLLVSGVDGLADHVPNGAHVVADRSVAGWQGALETAARNVAAMSEASIRRDDRLERTFCDNWQDLVSHLLAARGADDRTAPGLASVPHR